MNKSCLLGAVATAAVLAGCALPVDPSAPTATATATATALACALPSNCVSTLDGSAAPLRFDGDATQALARLRRTLSGYPNARIVRSDATAVDTIFTTTVGFEDEVAFRIDAAQHRIDYRSRSRIGLFDFGKNTSRMREFSERFAAAGN